MHQKRINVILKLPPETPPYPKERKLKHKLQHNMIDAIMLFLNPSPIYSKLRDIKLKSQPIYKTWS